MYGIWSIPEETMHEWLVCRGWTYSPEGAYNGREWKDHACARYTLKEAVFYQMCHDIRDAQIKRSQFQPVALIRERSST